MKTTTTINRAASLKGFTILELLISVIIIGILVAIIIPVLSNRASDARLAAAQQDLDAIQNAQQHAAIDTGYYYRLFVLDDVIGGDGVPSDTPAGGPRDIMDGIRDEQFRNDTAGNQELLFIDTATGLILPNGQDLYTRLVNNETSFNWRGPYLNIAKKTGFQPPAITPLPDALNNLDACGLPVDPWGSTYLFFTKEGLVKEADGAVVSTVVANDGRTYNCRVFDRPTVLSMGPNVSPGDGSGTGPQAGFGQGDDIFRQF